MFTMLKRPFTDCFYIQIVNTSTFYKMYFQVTFTFRGKVNVLRSKTLKWSKLDRLCIPLTSTNINLKINIIKGVDTKTILDKQIIENKNQCFMTGGSYVFPVSNDIPCPQL